MTPAKLIIATFIALVVFLSLLFPGETPVASIIFYFAAGVVIGLWFQELWQKAKQELNRWTR